MTMRVEFLAIFKTDGRGGRLGLLLLLALVSLVNAGEPHRLANLAVGRPATSTSIENDDHDAAHANDGNPETYWCADDEPEGGPDWWQVDLGKAQDLSGCEITWPYDHMNYRCRVEGSVDQKQWQLLSDQTKTNSRAKVQRLAFSTARGVRYVRITITGFDDGCSASISEVKVFGFDESH